ncbi:hypothetical protein CAPTEDRAFT_216780 [Capitella teleta]|uniref:Endonuclease/exonuclease/phosphatase domain-containing protein n=1 Tax=Capitella teleta TaxID=283909 RepID=R7V0C7_CAPTE|nr:hypothetical protein CAPTEDRAFT_216780 [Capitella teleta]|eukprot:ELU11972.1 hypothetical protein CAPTEDRAFT_216780 [Capitella teleta]
MLSGFLREIELLLSELHLDYTSMCVVGDFNIHVDKRHDLTSAALEQTLQGTSLHQVVFEPTHKHGDILDLVLVQEPERVSSLHADKHYGISDPSMVTFQLKLIPETSERPFLSGKALKHINMADLVHDKVRPKGDEQKGWYDGEIHEERQERRRLERKFEETELQVHFEMWKDLCTKVVRLIEQKMKAYFQNKLNGASWKEAFTLIDRLLAKDKTMTLPSEEPSVLVEKFSSFFRQKIAVIHATLDTHQDYPLIEADDSPCSCTLTNFNPVMENEIQRLILASLPKTCSLDPLPSSLLGVPDLLNKLSMDQHVGAATKAAYSNLRRIRQIRQHLTKDACAKIDLPFHWPVRKIVNDG